MPRKSRKRTHQNPPGVRNYDREIQKFERTLARLYNDDDHDGVANIFDCQPRNPKKQGVEPNIMQRKRLERLPIFVTDRPVGFGKTTEKIYHITSKEAKKKAPKARKRALSAIKKVPELVHEIETARPTVITFSSKKSPPESEGEPEGEFLGYATPTFKRIRASKKVIGEHGLKKVPKSGAGRVIIYASPTEKRRRYREEERGETIHATIHELHHVKQYKRYKTKELAAKRKGEYSVRPLEREAERSVSKLLKKRSHRYPDTEEAKEEQKKGMLKRFRVIVGAEKEGE